MKTTMFVFIAMSSACVLSAAPLQQQSLTQTQQTKNSEADTNKYQENSNFKQTPRAIMDDEIAKSIYNILAPTWISSGYPNVTFDVNNGTVNLRGYVESKEDKEKIEHSVKNIDGVKNIKNEISIGLPSQKPIALNTSTPTKSNMASTSNATTKDSGTTENDRLINTKIRDRIANHVPKGYETIVIATSDGAVTITGYVERVDDIQKISSEIKGVNGVKSITNKIAVKKQ